VNLNPLFPVINIKVKTPVVPKIKLNLALPLVKAPLKVSISTP
jgi:hypothetical protein